MKYIVTGQEILKIVGLSLQEQFKSGCEFVPTTMPYISDVTFVELTQDEIDRRLAHEAEMADFRKKWQAEDEEKKNIEEAAKQAAQGIAAAADTGNF